MGTYIKWHRQIIDNHIFRTDPTAWRVFEVLALIVNYETGQWSGGRNQLAYLCNEKPSTVYKALKRLETASMVTLVSNNKFTDISIRNWANYQQDGNSSKNNEVTTKEQPSNTLKRNKNIEDNSNSEVGSSKTNPKDLLSIVNRVTGRNFRVLPERGVKKTLDSFSLDEIETALTNLMDDDWHFDKIAGLKIDYLIRATTIDKFLHKKTKRYWTPDDTKEDD